MTLLLLVIEAQLFMFILAQRLVCASLQRRWQGISSKFGIEENMNGEIVDAKTIGMFPPLIGAYGRVTPSSSSV